MDVKELEWEVVVWMHLAHDRGRRPSVVNTVMNLPVP